jgi:putative transposase
MRILEVLTAAHSPWENPFVERLIGSVRRECLDHVLVLNERHLRRVLAGYFAYYHRADGRPIEGPEAGIVQILEVSSSCQGTVAGSISMIRRFGTTAAN